MPASSNRRTVRYTVAIEIFGSIAAERACSASTSGWSSASDSTRAITRRCSVIRSPRSAQSASRSIGWCKILASGPHAKTPRHYGRGAALLGIVGRDHRVVGGEAPAGAVFGGGQAVVGHQVALEHLHLLAVFEADDVIVLDRCAHRYCRLRLYFGLRGDP